MEEARQHPAVIPGRFAVLLFPLFVGELLSVVAILVLAFVAPKQVMVGVNVFGICLALRTTAIAAYGLAQGMIYSRPSPIRRLEQPFKFWLFLGLNLVGVAFGVFLTQVTHH